MCPLFSSGCRRKPEYKMRALRRGFPGGAVVKSCLPVQEAPETQVRSLGQEDPLEEELATRSTILAWEIPWTENPGRLWSMGSQESDMIAKYLSVCLALGALNN